MENNNKQSKIIQFLVKSLVSIAIAFACFAYGTLLGRVEGVEKVAGLNREEISLVKGDIKEIREAVKWIERMKDDYIKANGKLNFDNFLRELLASANFKDSK